MKKLIIILLAITAIFSGCRYKEGPMISFRSVEKRLLGTWQIVEFTSNGIDSLQYYNDTCGGKMRIWKPIHDSQIYSMNFGSDTFPAGYCHLEDNKKVLNVFLDNPFNVLGPIGNHNSNWKILELEMNELKISTDFNGRNYIISFKKLET